MRQTSHFTILANRLAQRAGSAVTVGVAAYILSVPDGVPITVQALCAHFAEGKVVISAALRELEAEGWLERRVERGQQGRVVTRTFVYDLPGAAGEAVPEAAVDAVSEAVPEAGSEAGAEAGPVAVDAVGVAEQEPRPGQGPDPVVEPEPPTAPVPAPPAADLLFRLPHRDRRLLLSEREIAALAPAVMEWLDRGVSPSEITAALTDRLPARIDRRPARILAHRLAALRPPARTGPPPPSGRPPVVPLQNCDGCDRAFRADRPGRCGGCRTAASEAVRCAA